MFSAHEIVEIKSFFIVSAVAISEAIEFMESRKFTDFIIIFFLFLHQDFRPKSLFVFSVISFKGITMELMKRKDLKQQ